MLEASEHAQQIEHSGKTLGEDDWGRLIEHFQR
jgi:hypothetical protein